MGIVKRVAIVAGVVVLALVGWVVFQFTRPAPEIVVSKETTWLTEPLDEDGLPDYAGYLLARAKEGVTPETNGAIPFLQALWPAGLEPGEQQRVVCEEVGMEVPSEVGMDLPLDDKQLEAALREWVKTRGPRPRPGEIGELKELESGEGDFQFDDDGDDGEEIDPLDYVSWAWSQPWTSGEIPPLGEWIDAHAAHFELLREAANKQAFYAPSPTLLLEPKTNLANMLLPSEQTMYSAVKCLHLRGMRSIAAGELGAAQEDWEAQLRLSRHLKGSFLVGQMVSIGMEAFANDLVLWMLDHPNLDPVVARQIFDVYRQLPVRQAIAKELDEGERLMLPSIMLAMSGRRVDPNGLDDEFSRLAHSPGVRTGIDWNIPLRMSNEWYDRMVDAAETQPYSARAEKFAQLFTELQVVSDRIASKPANLAVAALISRTSRSETLGEILVSLLLPAADAACEAQDRSNTERELMTVAAALAVYRLEQGSYPASLEALVPDLLQAVPPDIYHGKPLVYRHTGEGYLLYSLGPNGQDEGGSNEDRSILGGYNVELQGLAESLKNENVLRKLLDRPSAELLEDGYWPSVVTEIPTDADDIAIRLPLPRLKLPLPGE